MSTYNTSSGEEQSNEENSTPAQPGNSGNGNVIYPSQPDNSPAKNPDERQSAPSTEAYVQPSNEARLDEPLIGPTPVQSAAKPYPLTLRIKQILLTVVITSLASAGAAYLLFTLLLERVDTGGFAGLAMMLALAGIIQGVMVVSVIGVSALLLKRFHFKKPVLISLFGNLTPLLISGILMHYLSIFTNVYNPGPWFIAASAVSSLLLLLSFYVCGYALFGYDSSPNMRLKLMFLPVVGIALTVAVTLAAGTSTEAEIDFEVYKPAYMPAGSQLGTPDLLSRKSGEDRISFVEYRLELEGSPNADMLIAKYEPIYDRYIMSPEKCNVYGVYSGIISPVNNVEESVESLKGSNYSKIERGCSDKIITPGGIELWPHNDNHTSVFYYAKIESSLVILRREYYSGRTGKGHDEAFDEEAIKIFDSLEPLPKKEVRTRQY